MLEGVVFKKRSMLKYGALCGFKTLKKETVCGGISGVSCRPVTCVTQQRLNVDPVINSVSVVFKAGVF